MKSAYNLYCKILGLDNQFCRSVENAQMTGEPASDLIKTKILEGKPLMISRFGATELNAVLNYYFIKDGLISNVVNLAKGIPYFLQYKKSIIANLSSQSGFFPSNEETVTKFAELSLADLPDIDILGSWMKHEKFLYGYLGRSHQRVELGDLTPLRSVNPWSVALEGKKVLVVHPFEESIRSQYLKRTALFKDPRVLPEFELKTLKAVQSLAAEPTGFKSWFEALESMKRQIDKIDFDVAILGCGAYGMPLAAHIKRIGKQAVHLGGETQTLFGIKGARWEHPSYNYQGKFYNSAWVRPQSTEKIKNAVQIENACYW